MTDEEKLLTAKTEDLFKLCDKYCEPRFSVFLNEAEQGIIHENIGSRIGYNTGFFGGYADSERQFFGVFPEWDEFSEDKFPVAVLSVKKTYKKELTHRDYLGTVLSLGIDRSKTGDILVTDEGAFIFVTEDIADFIEYNLTKIANCGVKVKRTELNNENIPEREYEIHNVVAASQRLDAILAAALNVSRRESGLYINSGKVSVNHKPLENLSCILKEGDLLSVRGVGRIILDGIGTETRSGRIHVTVKKCIR